jgi:hypothetical protein
MTTLVAIQGDGWSVLGCDSRLSDEHGRFQVSKTPKIIDNNGVLIAGCGSSRASNVLHYGYRQPKPTAQENLNTYMTQKFIPEMRKNFVDAGIDMKEDGDVAQTMVDFLSQSKGKSFRFLRITLGIPIFVTYTLWVAVAMLPSAHWQRWVWKK